MPEGTFCSPTKIAEAQRAGDRLRLLPVMSSTRAMMRKYNPRAMKSLWNDAEAAQFDGPLGPRVYTSRLLGRDKSLVLHGGGNTSVKLDGKQPLRRGRQRCSTSRAAAGTSRPSSRPGSRRCSSTTCAGWRP